jgi:hypothetical protein
VNRSLASRQESCRERDHEPRTIGGDRLARG